MSKICSSTNVAQNSNFDNQTEKSESKRPLCQVTPEELILKPDKKLHITIKNLSDKRHEFRVVLHSVRFSLKNARTFRYKAFVHKVCDGGRDFSVSIVDRAMEYKTFGETFSPEVLDDWKEGKLVISQIEANKKDELIAELVKKDLELFPLYARDLTMTKPDDTTVESWRLKKGFFERKEYFVETPLALREMDTTVLKVTLDDPSDSYIELRDKITRNKMPTVEEPTPSPVIKSPAIKSPAIQSPAKEESPQENDKNESPAKSENVDVSIHPESSTKEDTSRPRPTPTKTPTKTPIKKAQTPKKQEPVKVGTLKEMKVKKVSPPTPQTPQTPETPSKKPIVNKKKKKKKCTIL